MTCSTSNLPNGINRNCLKALREVKTILIYKSGQSTFDNAQALDNLENMRVKSQEEENLYIFNVDSSTPTKGETNVVTSGYGISRPAGENPPQLTAYGLTNACDFAEILKAFEGGTFEVMFLTADGSIMSVYDSGDIRGFVCNIQGVSFIPDRDGQAEQFQLEFYFLDAKEFRNYIISDVHYTSKQLSMQLPIGLSMVEAVAYSAGSNFVNVYNRCSTVAYSDALEGEIVDTNIVGEVVTATPTYNSSTGQYEIVFAKGAGLPAAGDWIKYRLVEKDTLIYTRVTNNLEVEITA